ncbi:MAG: HEPN domain-containing protein [Syntrophorhabdales bacterium]|jgi:hypothetical protein
MTGRAQVQHERQRLDATFQRASGTQGDPELLSDFAKYLCVLVSGFLEQAVIELLLEHVRTHSHSSVLRHVEQRLRRFTSANRERIIQLLRSFDPEWGKDLETYLVDEYKDAVDGVVALRHAVAHGRSVTITMARVFEYYGRIKQVVEHIAGLCVPP